MLLLSLLHLHSDLTNSVFHYNLITYEVVLVVSLELYPEVTCNLFSCKCIDEFTQNDFQNTCSEILLFTYFRFQPRQFSQLALG